MKEIKAYHLGGSCCDRYIKEIHGEKVFVKEIDKNIQGIDNGYKKFYYEIQHMMKYESTGLYPKILRVLDDVDKYSVEMEYCYEGITLSDLLRNKTVDMMYYKESFSFIMDQIYEKMYADIFSVLPAVDYLDKCYFDRVLNRIRCIEKDGLLKKYNYSNIINNMITYGCYINNEYYPPLYEYISYLKNDKTLRCALNIPFVNNMHYDLCPLNILVDANLDSTKITDFRMIDVRGEGETGKSYRHFMYDMGKMLLGLDCFDLFRIFNGMNGELAYRFEIKEKKDKIPNIQFGFGEENDIAFRYKIAYQHFWDHMEERNYYSVLSKETAENLKFKFLFSHSMMYHPDIPCRIIYGENEEVAILLYIRGMMIIRKFMEEFYGMDPVGKFKHSINIWEI